jgi:hypothetical protein
MGHLLRGGLVEYGSDFLGPLPNIVIFQFNPETMSRVIQIPPRPVGGAARETTQAGDAPIERITIRAEFSAADQRNDANPLALAFGVGPQLAALEKMANPSNLLGGLIGAALDAVGSALEIGGSAAASTQPIPRDRYPRILFIWGLTRVLPVVLESMTINEVLYDTLLNPIQADVTIGMAVNAPSKCSDDTIAQGAYTFSTTAKEAQAVANLANTVQLAPDTIPF